jgi:hypothetical protein
LPVDSRAWRHSGRPLRLATSAILALAFLCNWHLKGQNPNPTGASTAQAQVSRGQPSGASAAPAPERDTITDLRARVQKLESIAAGKSDKDTSNSLFTAGIAALAVLAAAGLGLYGQYVTAKRTAELARRESIYRHTERILEFRVKQLELFYAPMFALLGQSKGLYDKMLHQLAEDDPQRYRWSPDPSHDRFQVLAKDGTWQGFRLLDQLPAVRKFPKAMAIATEILRIGDSMTKIISSNAGLASEKLIGMLGQYMAHYAILATVDKLGEIEPYEPGWHQMGYFPRELDKEVEAGYRELSGFIDEHAREGKRILASLEPDKRSES